MQGSPRFQSLTGLSGSLLVANPGLHDPNFEKTVILLPVHSTDSGALGVILNRPTGKTLGELYPDQAFDKLANIRIFQGGPVDNGQLILTAWKWDANENSHKMFFGISSEHAMELIESGEEVTVRGYLGYAGWSAGQLESELNENAWTTKPIASEILDREESTELWDILAETQAESGGPIDLFDDLGFPAPPEDPELN